MWKIHCEREFRGCEPEEMETWRELYLVCFYYLILFTLKYETDVAHLTYSTCHCVLCLYNAPLPNYRLFKNGRKHRDVSIYRKGVPIFRIIVEMEN